MNTEVRKPWYTDENRSRVLIVAFTSILVIAIADAISRPNIGAGYLYLLPIILISPFLSRPQIVLVAGICDVLREVFGYFPSGTERWVRSLSVLVAFVVTGFLVHEMVAHRKTVAQHMAEIKLEVSRRLTAEQQLQAIINSSPVGILTVNAVGAVELANEAAHQIFGFASGALPGQHLDALLPSLSGLHDDEQEIAYRTALECRARRNTGEYFVAHAWVSRYHLSGRAALAVMVLDTSEDLRDREESGLNQLLAGSRIMVGAVSHEIRNIVGAISAIHANLSKIPGVTQTEDFIALESLIDGLRSVVSSNLLMASQQTQKGVDVRRVVEDLRLIIEPTCKEIEADLVIDVGADLPRVRGEHHRLLQVFLNLSNNSIRALQGAAVRRLQIAATPVKGGLSLQFSDTGGGVSSPEDLFHPFQPGSQSSGLGLYVSRAIVRSFAGDMHYHRVADRSWFVVDLAEAIPGDKT